MSRKARNGRIAPKKNRKNRPSSQQKKSSFRALLVGLALWNSTFQVVRKCQMAPTHRHAHACAVPDSAAAAAAGAGTAMPPAPIARAASVQQMVRTTPIAPIARFLTEVLDSEIVTGATHAPGPHMRRALLGSLHALTSHHAQHAPGRTETVVLSAGGRGLAGVVSPSRVEKRITSAMRASRSSESTPPPKCSGTPASVTLKKVRLAVFVLAWRNNGAGGSTLENSSGGLAWFRRARPRV